MERSQAQAVWPLREPCTLRVTPGQYADYSTAADVRSKEKPEGLPARGHVTYLVTHCGPESAHRFPTRTLKNPSAGPLRGID